jgi:ferredoxin-type protein NapF
MRNILRSEKVRPLSAIFAVALAIPFSLKILTGFYSWFSPYILLNSVFSLKSFVGLNLVASLILMAVLLRKRWFCRFMCPVGWGCDVVSGLSRHKSLSYRRFPDIGKWLAITSLSAAIVGFPLFIIFDPLAFFNGFFTIFSGKLSLIVLISLAGLPVLFLIHLFLPGIWCAKLCPLGGLQLIISDLKSMLQLRFTRKKPESELFDSGRRYFLMSGLGFLAGASIPRFLKPSGERLIRPPAAVEPALFNALCCRCGSCTKVCPTDIIIPHTDFHNVLSWMTPEVIFKTGYCLETCNLCSKVCPSGAITLFSAEAKSQLFIGSAEIQLENCLLTKNMECVKCKESCKYDAISFLSEKNILRVTPVVDIKKCVGCGACSVICPAACIVIKPIAIN